MRYQIEAGPHTVVCQKWEESEAGWGTRPDGFSLHLTFNGLKKYVSDYWDRMPEEAPAEYERPHGTPYEIGVSDSVKLKLEEKDGDMRFGTNFRYPGSGGRNGWMQEIPPNKQFKIWPSEADS